MTDWAVSAVAAVAVATAARLAGWLTTGGAVCAAAIGALVFKGASWCGAAALLMFFVTSSVATWLRRRMSSEKPMRPRTWTQVMANGGAAGVAAILLLLGDSRAYPALVASLAAANADTWATEVGQLLARKPRLITTFEPVPPGTSGAVSLIGFAAAAGGALAVGAFGPHALQLAMFGWFGALMDSVLGATVQAKYLCKRCGRRVETATHCDGPADRHAGCRFVSNDLVNLLQTFFAGLLGYFLA